MDIISPFWVLIMMINRIPIFLKQASSKLADKEYSESLEQFMYDFVQ